MPRMSVLGTIDGGRVDLAHEVRRDDRRQQPDDHDDDHDLEQRETLLGDAKRCSDHAHYVYLARAGLTAEESDRR